MGKHFTLSELTRSDTASRLGILNIPDARQADSLIHLIDDVLDPVREHLARPVAVTSGFRCPELNRQVGGTPTSQHTKGQAADLVIHGGTPADNRTLALAIFNLGTFDQLIFENTSRYDLNPQWVHVSHRPDGTDRHQVMKKVRGENIYRNVRKEDLA